MSSLLLQHNRKGSKYDFVSLGRCRTLRINHNGRQVYPIVSAFHGLIFTPGQGFRLYANETRILPSVGFRCILNLFDAVVFDLSRS